MFRAKVIVLVAMAMLFAQLQCVAACAGNLCAPDNARTESIPPCHRHHNHSHDKIPGCPQQALNPPATSPQTAHVDAPVMSVLGFVNVAFSIQLDTTPAKIDFSSLTPPESVDRPATVLRI